MSAKTWKLRKLQIMMLGNVQRFNSSYNTYIAHRRGGKSKGGAMWFDYEASKLLQEKEIFKLKGDVDSRNPNMSYLAPTKRQARDIIWEYFQEHLGRYHGAKPNEAQLTITIPRPLTGDRIKVSLYASKFHDRMRGTQQRKIFIDELQDAPVEALSRSVLPTMDSLGEENVTLFASGTVKGKDHLHDWCLDQHEQGNILRISPVTMSGTYTPEEIEELKKKYAHDVFLREYMCDFGAPLEGTFFNKRLTNLQKVNPYFFNATYDERLPIIAGFDLGIGKALAVWVIQVPSPQQINILDFYEDYVEMGDLADDMKEEGTYPDVIFMPHDGNTRQSTVRGEVKKKHVVKTAFPDCYVYEPLKKATKVETAIQNASNHLHLLHFPPKDARTSAHTGLAHLMAYGRSRDKLTGHYRDVIDKSRGVDHAADALRTVFEGLKCRNKMVRRIPTFRRNTGVVIQPTSHYHNPMLQNQGSIFNTWREEHASI